MVNYCCVLGCGRNSRSHPGTTFYSIPKERQVEWMRAANRLDLLGENSESKVNTSHRLCSRHFAPSDIINKHLSPTAMPTLCLNGEKQACQVHNGVVCNNCRNSIVGFRYKCMDCQDFDLCHRCESREVHPLHVMLRMPKPTPETVTEAMRKTYKETTSVAPAIKDTCKKQPIDDLSSDDEPITKYISRPPADGVDLSDNVKEVISKEVLRALSSVVKLTVPKIRNKRSAPKRTVEVTRSEVESDLGQFLILPKQRRDIEFADVTNSDNQYRIEVKNEQAPVLREHTLQVKVNENGTQEFILDLQTA